MARRANAVTCERRPSGVDPPRSDVAEEPTTSPPMDQPLAALTAETGGLEFNTEAGFPNCQGCGANGGSGVAASCKAGRTSGCGEASRALAGAKPGDALEGPTAGAFTLGAHNCKGGGVGGIEVEELRSLLFLAGHDLKR